MSFSLLAFSLSTTFTKIGAIAAFGALLGIAVLSLLVFSQAREIKRLREWAGRAPERAADMEQKVSEAASARAQQQTPAVQAVRPVPRTEPIHARPAAAVGPATRVVGQPVQPAPTAAQPLTAAGAPAAPLATPPVTPAGAPPPAAPVVPGQPVAPAPATAAGATQAAQPSTPAAPKSIPWQQQPSAPSVASPPLPPPPSPPPVTAPNGAGAPSTPTPPASAPATAAAAGAAAAAAEPSAPRAPTPPAAPAQPAVTTTPKPSEPRRPAPPSEDLVAKRARARAGTTPPATTGAQPSPLASPARTSRQRAERDSSGGSSRRMIGVIAAGLAIVVVLVVLLAGKGGSSPTQGTGSTSAHTTSGSKATKAHNKAAKAPAKATNPADTAVSVLNGTESTGLARRVSTSLQQKGYSQATAQFGSPPGTHEVTVVEYASGHQADAEGVARSLSVSHVQPMEQAVATLAGSAKVVVIVGADEATTVP